MKTRTALVVAILASIVACKKHEPLPPECESELALMRCVADKLRPGPTRPDVGTIRAEYERDLAAKGSDALAARCRVELQSLKLTSGAMCADAG